MIENEDLKLLLLKIYNHQNNRNYAISNLIDIFSIEFYNTVYQKFRIDINVNKGKYMEYQLLVILILIKHSTSQMNFMAF